MVGEYAENVLEGDPKGAIALIQSDPEVKRTFCRGYLQVLKIGMYMFCSFTISLAALVSSILLAKMPRDDLDEVDLLASITNTPTYFNTFLFIAAAATLGAIASANNLQGQYRKAVKDREPEERLRAIEEGISYTNRTAMLIASGVSPFPAIFYLFSDQILVGSGQSNTSAEYSYQSLWPWSIGVFFVLARIAAEISLNAARKQRDLTLIDVGMFILSCVIAYILSFGVIWEPMGIVCIPWTFSIEAILTCSILSLYMWKKGDLKRFKFFKCCGYDRRNIEGIAKTIGYQSITSIMNISAEVFMGYIISELSGVIDTESQAALSYSFQLYNVALLTTSALSIAGGLEVGQAAGEGDKTYTRKLVLAAILANLTVSALLIIPTLIYPRWIIDVFSSLSTSSNATESTYNYTTIEGGLVNNNIEEKNAVYSRIMCFIIASEACRYTFVYIDKSLAHPWSSFGFSTTSLLVGLALAVGLGLGTDLGVTGLLIGWLTGTFVSNGLLMPHTIKISKDSELELVNQRMNDSPCQEIKRVLSLCTCLRSRPSIRKARTISTHSQISVNPLTEDVDAPRT